jgi:hypothetical protein
MAPRVIKRFPPTTFRFTDGRVLPNAYYTLLNQSSSARASACIVTISVKELLYFDGKEVYDISYEYNTTCWDPKADRYSHPLYYSETDTIDEDNMDGEIIAKNIMTTGMIEMLLMSFEDMSPLVGMSRPIDYKKQIMQFISKLYD